jgi:protein CpxP
MNTLRRMSLILAVAVAAGGLIASNASGTEKPTRRGGLVRERLAERAREKLDLTDDQIARIKEVFQSEKETLRDLVSRLREARAVFRNAIRAADATEASVRVAASKVADVQADLAVERLVLRGKLKPILTAEQTEKLNPFMTRMDKLIERRINARMSD